MTQEQYKKGILREIQSLNRRIDMKIIKGESYAGESRRHKMLRAKLRESHQPGFLGLLFGKLTLQ
jgi:hypothetical protein